ASREFLLSAKRYFIFLLSNVALYERNIGKQLQTTMLPQAKGASRVGCAIRRGRIGYRKFRTSKRLPPDRGAHSRALAARAVRRERRRAAGLPRHGRGRAAGAALAWLSIGRADVAAHRHRARG